MDRGLGCPKCVGLLGWFKRLRMLGWLEFTCPTTGACLFKVRPGVLSKTLSHMWGKLNLPIFLFKVGLLTLINMDFLMFLAKLWLDESLSSTTNILFHRIYQLFNNIME